MKYNLFVGKIIDKGRNETEKESLARYRRKPLPYSFKKTTQH